MEPGDTDCVAVEGRGCLAARAPGLPCEDSGAHTGSDTGVRGAIEGGGCGCATGAFTGDPVLGLVLAGLIAWRRCS